MKLKIGKGNGGTFIASWVRSNDGADSQHSLITSESLIMKILSTKISLSAILTLLLMVMVSTGCNRHNGAFFASSRGQASLSSHAKAPIPLSDAAVSAAQANLHAAVVNISDGRGTAADQLMVSDNLGILANHIKAGGNIDKAKRKQLKQDLRVLASKPNMLTASTTANIDGDQIQSAYDNAINEGKVANANTVQAAVQDQKSAENSTLGIQIVAAILLVFLGYLGVHRYFLGRWGSGFLQLLLTIVGAILLLGAQSLWASGAATAALALGTLGWIVLGGLLLWLVIDLIRILVGSLHPVG